MGITIDELRARHERLAADRVREHHAHELRDAGYGFVLGELELMIEELTAREAEAEPQEQP